MKGIATQFSASVQDSKTVVFVLHIDKDLSDFVSDDYNFETCLRLFSLSEQQSIRSKKYGQSKELLNRLFTRYILNVCRGVSDNDLLTHSIRFKYNKFGKPLLPESEESQKQPLQFNASSSNNTLSLVVQFDSHTPIGIDLSHSEQKISPATCVEDFKQIFASEEYSYLKSIQEEGERYTKFNHFWTLKEAFTKLLGCGLNVDLSLFSFKVNDSKINDSQRSTSLVPRDNGDVFREIEVSWDSDISVNAKGLYDIDFKFIQDLEDKYYCISSGLSPIIVSVISQVPLEDTKVIQLNIHSILQEYIDSI